MKILSFGSLNLDKVYSVDHFVRAGETLSSAKLEAFCGGKGLNQSVAASRAGGNVYHAGCVGAADGGMLLDTKQFSRNTGVRTFSAALYLRSEGASPSEVQLFFKTGLDDFMREVKQYLADI